MRRVILQEFVTLNGLASGPNDSVDFVPGSMAGDQSFGQRQMAFMDSMDRILLGRVTYEMFAAYWPNVTSGDDKSFADKVNAIPKIVFSRTLAGAPWGTWDNATVVRTGAATEVVRLKRENGKDMVIWGSISLAQSLMSQNLIDEYQLVICPVVLNRGKPLFRAQADAVDLMLLNVTSFDRGAVLLTYTKATEVNG
ncbi:MAG: dihydrofolate reductase family protein [Longimicrobiales bacterium]